MKWNHPYHEFDMIADKLCNPNGSYYLWGSANIGREVLEHFGKQLPIVGVVDADKDKQGKQLGGFVIESPDILSPDAGYIVIVTTSAYTQVKKELTLKGFSENENFFDYFPFFQIYQLYKNNCLLSRRIDISLTEKCTLKCKKCNMFMPYFSNPSDMALDDVLTLIDQYFHIVDYVESFNLLGGEPFLYKQLGNVIKYVGEKYRSRIKHFIIFTNGMLLPHDADIELLSKYMVEIQISDYTNKVPYKERLDQLVAILEENKIDFYFLRSTRWGDFGFPENPNDIPEEKLLDYFEGCKAPFRGLYNDKVFFCHLETSAIRAGLHDGTEDDYFDLNQNSSDIKKKFLEFDFGYSKRGYVSFCAKCRGCDTVNRLTVPAAEQMGGIYV